MTETHLGDVLHAYLDNELGTERSLEVRAHLASCARCRQEYEALRALSTVLHRTLKPVEPSADLLRRLRRGVRSSDPARWRGRVGWAGGVLATAAVLLLVALPSLRPQSRELIDDVVAGHLRSLQADHLTDVASSDRHAVKPWFQGKVPFSLSVRDFQDQGFPLVGGRLDYLAGRPVAALVYRTRQHAINVFLWPAEGGLDSTPLHEARTGINALHWTKDGMAVWVVSDASREELERLATLLREPAS